MKSEFSLFQNLSGLFNGFSALLVFCVFDPLSHEKRQTIKNARPSVLANFTRRLPLNLQDFIVERQKTLNLAALGTPRPFSRHISLGCVSEDSIRRTTKWQHPYSLRPSFPFSYLRKKFPLLNAFYSSDELGFFGHILFISYIYIFSLPLKIFFGVGTVMK